MQKAGLVFQKRLQDWFRVDDPKHVQAYFYFLDRNDWPKNFLPSTVWVSHTCLKQIGMLMSESLFSEGKLVNELKRIQSIISEVDVSFFGYRLHVEPIGDRYLLYVEYDEADVNTGVVEVQMGRPLLLNEHETTCQIVQAAFRCVLASLEHRAREQFLFRGERVMNPHRNLGETDNV